ncbi:hypothetical protein P389DRAFT_194509 [Cystobasidium minutum MCA 4210]|uniref:uncharacterized protein n=1 Tax=Cystobasidium minutum MCA 4210 TaxID=1397322 RepID=UPI0034CFDA0C|eukprot:jgi/Rhomi1/194509/gm1.2723_g
MTLPGNTTRASQPKALYGDKHSHGIGGEKVMKKHGEGAHNWGGSGHELEDEMAAQEDAQRDAEEALAEGDERPSGGQSFTQRAIGDATYDAGNQGTLSEEFAEKEGAYITRQLEDPSNMDLKDIARSSGAASFPTGDAVSSAAAGTNTIEEALAGYSGSRTAGHQEILGSTGTSHTA